MSEIDLKTVSIGPFSFHLQTGALSQGKTRIPLRPKAAQMLGLLVTAKGSVRSHDELYQAIWGNLVVERQDGLHQLARDIRKALGDDSRKPNYLRNIPGRGYQLITHVRLAPSLPHRDWSRPALFATGFLSFPIVFLIWCLLQT